MITPTSQAAGKLSQMAMPLNAGTARVELRGTYTGTTTRDYIVQITSVVPALYRYSDDGGDTWSGDIAAVAFQWDTLTHGVQFRFVLGPPDTTQIVVGDEWHFKGIREYGVEYLIDQSRNTECRTGAITTGNGMSWQFDLGSTRAPIGLVIFDHNFPSGANIAIAASANSNMTPLSVNQAVPWASEKISYLVTGGPHSYRYWSLTVNSLPADVSYLRASEVFLGDVITMSREFRIGYVGGEQHIGQSPLEVLIRGQGAYGARVPRYQLEFPAVKAGALEDLGKLRTLWGLSHDAATRSQRPFFTVFNSVSGLEITELTHWASDLDENHLFLDRVDMPIELTGVIRAA